MLELFMLGTGGTYPLVHRALASAVVRIEGKGFLIDCGEATQIEMQKCNMSFSSIDYILITHMHADHVSGLLGMLLAIKQAQRTKPIVIIGPKKIKQYIENMYLVTSVFPFPLKFIELESNTKGTIKCEQNIVIKYTPSKHKIPCFAYSIELVRRPRFLFEKAEALGIPRNKWNVLSKGQDLEYEGKVYKHIDFEDKPRKGLKLSYVTDTRPLQSLREFVSGSDIAVIEGMYRGDEGDAERAKEKFHMTWDESVSLVKNNNIKEVILTHYSPSLQIEKTDSALVKSKCDNIVLGRDGMFRELSYEEDKEEQKEEKKGVKKGEQSMSKKVDKLMNPRREIIKKFAKQMGLTNAVIGVKEINAFTFRVHLVGDVYQNWLVYKSLQSKPEDYQTCSKVDNYYVFVTKGND